MVTDSRFVLLKLARPNTVKFLPVNNQMVLLMALANIACTRPACADDIVNELLVAVDSLRCNGVLLTGWRSCVFSTVLHSDVSCYQPGEACIGWSSKGFTIVSPKMSKSSVFPILHKPLRVAAGY